MDFIGGSMRTFYTIQNNGQRWYVTCAEWGPYTDIEQALAEADRLNQIKKQSQKKANQGLVLEWRSKQNSSLR